jgi:hypothetical protein
MVASLLYQILPTLPLKKVVDFRADMNKHVSLFLPMMATT